MGFNFSCNFHVIQTLIKEDFSSPCLAHASFFRNEINMFCFDCCKSFCSHCLPDGEHHPHGYHRILQIRRYMYADVLLLKDAQELINCSEIQSYTTNGAKVLYLKQRPYTRPTRTSGNSCTTCDRFIQYPYTFCSIQCKVHHLKRTGKKCTKEKEETVRTIFDSRNMEDDVDESLHECNVTYSQIIDLTEIEDNDDDDNNLHECDVVEMPYWVSKLGIYKMASTSAFESLEFLRTNYSSDESSDDEGW